jgi:hypothetical protein
MAVPRGSSKERLATDSLRLHKALPGPAKTDSSVVAQRSVPGREGRQQEPAFLRSSRNGTDVVASRHLSGASQAEFGLRKSDGHLPCPLVHES